MEGTGHRILVIDDDQDVRDTVTLMLAEEGYDIRQAPNGAVGLRLLEAEAADLVVADIFMPDKEGIETIRAIRERWPATRVIAISGGGSIQKIEYLDYAREFGADATLAKPFSLEDVTATVRRLLAPLRSGCRRAW